MPRPKREDDLKSPQEDFKCDKKSMYKTKFVTYQGYPKVFLPTSTPTIFFLLSFNELFYNLEPAKVNMVYGILFAFQSS